MSHLSELTPKRIQRLVNKFGVEVDWYPSRLCSCVGDNNGIFRNGCGCIHGYYYDEPKTFTLIRTQSKNRTIQTNEGAILQADTVFTIPRYSVIGRNQTELEIYDQITKGDVLVVKKYTHTDTDILTMGIRDEVWAFDIDDITAISQLNKVFKEGKDYSFVDAKIIWHGKGADEPEYQTAYAVKFTAKQQYIVWTDLTQQRGTEDTQLPRRMSCYARPYGTSKENPIDTIPFNHDIYAEEN